jgi:hypothetical protein
VPKRRRESQPPAHNRQHPVPQELQIAKFATLQGDAIEEDLVAGHCHVAAAQEPFHHGLEQHSMDFPA